MDLDEARRFIRENHRAVLVTTRADGRPQMSIVAAGLDGAGRVVISTQERSVKARNLRRRPQASALVMTDNGGQWIQIEGTAEVLSMPEAMEPLVEYYRNIAGEHPDWDEYRQAMQQQGRCLVRITLERAGPG